MLTTLSRRCCPALEDAVPRVSILRLSQGLSHVRPTPPPAACASGETQAELLRLARIQMHGACKVAATLHGSVCAPWCLPYEMDTSDSNQSLMTESEAAFSHDLGAQARESTPGSTAATRPSSSGGPTRHDLAGALVFRRPYTTLSSTGPPWPFTTPFRIQPQN